MWKNSKISLVGAGPGDPELLTIKGLRAIQSADVICYDALINPALLEHNTQAEKIFVGKRRGFQQISQSEINQLLVERAAADKRVVRLKGGDPLVFGRACEELKAAQLFDIPTEVIPGISSYAGIAAQHQIPLTQRNKSQSFWVLTGHTASGTLSDDIALAAQSSATIVILMGMRFLKEIMAVFAQHKPADYPVAIVQNGTTKATVSLVSQLNQIVEDVEKNKIGNPAVIFLGPNVTAAVTRYQKLIKPTAWAL